MIYFIQDGPEGPIKIGTTVRLSTRLGQLKVEHGPDLTVLAVIDGAFAEEQALHQRFDATRVGRPGREWFVPSPDLMDLIRTEGRAWDGKDEVPTTSVRIGAEASSALRTVATLKGLTIAEYFDAELLPIINRGLVTEGKRLARGDKPE